MERFTKKQILIIIGVCVMFLAAIVYRAVRESGNDAVESTPTPSASVETITSTTPPIPTLTAEELAIYEESVTWNDVKADFQALEAEIKENEESGYTLSSDDEENIDALIQRLADGYPSLYTGVTKSTLETALDMYEAGRYLMNCDNPDVASLGELGKDFILSCVGFRVEDALVAQCNFYSELIKYQTTTSDGAELEKPMAYDEIMSY